MIKIDYAQYSNEELEDVWQQVDDYEYADRAIDIYLAMHKRKIERFDSQLDTPSFENEMLAFLWHSDNQCERDEEYQYQQRELSGKEQRVVKLIENRCQSKS